MLKRQGIILEDPVAPEEAVEEAPPPPREDTLFKDEEKQKVCSVVCIGIVSQLFCHLVQEVQLFKLSCLLYLSLMIIIIVVIHLIPVSWVRMFYFASFESLPFFQFAISFAHGPL